MNSRHEQRNYVYKGATSRGSKAFRSIGSSGYGIVHSTVMGNRYCTLDEFRRAEKWGLVETPFA